MSTSLLHPDALLSILVSEFKPAPKAKPTPAPKPESTLRLTPLTREEYLRSNPVSWKPVAIVHHLYVQTCQCCGEETEFLGNTFIRHHNANLRAFWETPRSTLTPLDPLPREFVTHTETVEQCPHCLRAEAVMCEYPMQHPHQLTIFH